MSRGGAGNAERKAFSGLRVSASPRESVPPHPGVKRDDITAAIIDCSIKIHTDLGPGLLESV